MLRIALCDDDLSFLEGLRRRVESWFASGERPYKVTVETYSSSECLGACLKEKSFDLLFLDVEMPGVNGLDLARRVREELPWAIIVFLTSHEEFAPEGYRVQALRYVYKRLLDRQLDEALLAAAEAFEKLEEGCLDVITGAQLDRVLYRDILYVRHVFRVTQVVTVSGETLHDRRGLREVFDAIGSERFLFIDRGTFVNLDHIRRIDNGRVVLRGGETLTISRRMLSQVKMTINQVLGG